MTRNSEGSMHWDSERGYEDSDDLLSLDAEAPYAEAGATSLLAMTKDPASIRGMGEVAT